MGQFKSHWDEAFVSARRALELEDHFEAYLHLIVALAEGRSGNQEKARDALTQAATSWPEKLEKFGYGCAVQGGLLWFVGIDEALALRHEVEALLGD